MARKKVKRRYEVEPGTYLVEWDWAQVPLTEEPPMESSVEFEYKGGSWSNFDDTWMDVFVKHAKPKVTKGGEKMGEMHQFASEDAEDYGVQPTWMAENTDLDYTNLTDWANANDTDDMKYLIGGFFGGVLATAIGAIAGEWTIQKLKGKGLL